MKINRKKSIRELINELESKGFKKWYINDEVLDSLENKGPKTGEVEFFNLGKYATNSEVIQEYEKKGLEPDIGAVLTHLISKPSEVDDKWIAVQMPDNSYVYVFRGSGVVRVVFVHRFDRGWGDGWWFAGRRKSSKLETKTSLDTLPLVLEINGIKYRRDE